MNASLPSAQEVRAHMDPGAREKSYIKAIGLLLVVGLFYVATFVGCVASPWWIQLLCIPANSLAIGMLFVIGHDACHSCYSPSRRLDHWIARLTLAPALFPNECWKVLHNYYHHGFTCLRGKDHAWQPVTFGEYKSFSLGRRLLERHYKSISGLATYWLLAVWVRHALLPGVESRYFLRKRIASTLVDYAIVVTFISCAALASIFLRSQFVGAEPNTSLGFQAIFFGVLLPFWLFSLQAGLAILVQHTHPKTIWFATKEEWSFFAANIQATIHFRYPFPFNKLYLDVMEHNAHHVDTSIPIYNLLTQQRRLESAYPQDIVVEDFSVATIRRILRTCQLYDFERHCWMTFDGKPSTDSVCLRSAAGQTA